VRGLCVGVNRTMKNSWPRWMGASFVLFGLSGCAGFWEELMSNERDWAYITGHNKPDPLVVIRDSNDGFRRAQALGELKEPLQNGGNARDQEAILAILGKAAKDEYEPYCRLAAIRTLGRFHDPRAARTLEEVYRQRPLPFTPEINSLIRKESLVALENTHDPQAQKLMILVARQPGPPPDASLTDRQQTQDEKTVAIRALGKYREAECADALKFVLKTEKDIALRHRALQSLGEVTGKNWPESYDAWQIAEVQPQPGNPNGNYFIQLVSGVFK
jgi:hypothetical protein